MASSYNNIEEKIQKAVDAYKRDESAKIAFYARKFNVPYSRLRGRIQGRQTKLRNQNSPRLLDNEQEALIRRWIDVRHQAGRPPTAKMVQDAANEILQRNSTPSSSSSAPPTVSKMWAYRFIQRRPTGYRRAKRNAKDPKRAIAEALDNIHALLDRLEIRVQSRDSQPYVLIKGMPEVKSLLDEAFQDHEIRIDKIFRDRSLLIDELEDQYPDNEPPQDLIKGLYKESSSLLDEAFQDHNGRLEEVCWSIISLIEENDSSRI